MRDVFWRPAEERQSEYRPVLYAPPPVPPGAWPEDHEHEAGRPEETEEPRVIIIDL